MWIDCILIFLQNQVVVVCYNSSINCVVIDLFTANLLHSMNALVHEFSHPIKNHQPRRSVEVRLVLFKKCVQTVATTNSMRHRPLSTLTQGTTLDTQTRESRDLLLSGKVANCAPRFICNLILKKSGRVKLSRWNRQSVQNQVTRRMSDTAKLSLVAGSRLFHDDDDDDANLWQLGLFAKIARCVPRFITIVKGVYVCNDNVAMFSSLAPIKIFRLNRPTRPDACAIM